MEDASRLFGGLGLGEAAEGRVPGQLAPKTFWKTNMPPTPLENQTGPSETNKKLQL